MNDSVGKHFAAGLDNIFFLNSYHSARLFSIWKGWLEVSSKVLLDSKFSGVSWDWAAYVPILSPQCKV